MAVLTQAQLAASSSAVYTTNNANQITAAIIRPFNDNWISSSVLIPMTSSMSVGFAATASFLIGGGGNAFPYSGSAVITGSLNLTGSAVNKVVSLNGYAANTASVDCRQSNLFSITLNSAATTFFNFTNVLEGQTGNIYVLNQTNSSASFSSNVKQPSGSFYNGGTSGNVDLLSFVSVGSTVYLVNSKRFI
jgi:hypothetical protein